MKTDQLNIKIIKNIFLGWFIGLIAITFSAYPASTVEPAYINYAKIPKEFEVKAVYLYNFLQFVHWPEDKCNVTDNSREIIVLGNSSVKGVLKNLQAKLKEKNKELNLTFHKSYRKDLNFSNCCLIFISDSELDNLPGILAKTEGKPILTVADSEAFREKGTMITLISSQNKVRWIINRRPVKEAGLRLSSQLLDIAVKVID